MLTTHDMDEAAELADRVGIMDHGKLLALDTPAALTRALPGQTTLEVALALDGASAEALVGELGALEGVERVEQIGATPNGGGPSMGGGPDGGDHRELRARLYLTGEAPRWSRRCHSGGRAQGRLTAVRIGTPSLEDVFIQLTGRALR